MKNRFRFTVVLLMLLIAPQQTDAHLDRVGFEHLSVKQGLSIDFITCLLQDREGFMWLVPALASINTMATTSPSSHCLQSIQPFFSNLFYLIKHL